MGWTDDRVATLKKLWLDGLSCSQIAKQLGGVTRNAVIGKVHRLGLSGRAAPSMPARAVFRAPAPRPVRPPQTLPKKAVAAPKEEPPPEVRVEEPGSATMLTLGSHMCKWPIGDPLSADFTFCGRRSGEKGPYCGEHTKDAHGKPEKKRAPRQERHDTQHINF